MDDVDNKSQQTVSLLQIEHTLALVWRPEPNNQTFLHVGEVRFKETNLQNLTKLPPKCGKLKEYKCPSSFEKCCFE